MAVLHPRHDVATVKADDRRRVDAPAFGWFALEPTRATAEFCALAVSWPLLGLARPGDGHPVTVLPGFGTTLPREGTDSSADLFVHDSRPAVDR